MIRSVFVFLATIAFAYLQVVPAEAQWTVKREQINSRGVTLSFGGCAGCDFSGKDLTNSHIKQSNLKATLFNRANLSGSRIYESDLTGAHFKRAFLARVRGRQVILQGANMTDVILTESILNNSSFSGASLTGADIARCTFLKSNFNGAKMQNTKAMATDFSGSHFVRAELDNANLTGANFSGAHLQSVEFGKAQMHGSFLNGAQLQGANLSTVKGLQQGQLDSACGDAETQLPVGLSIPYCIVAEADMKFAPHPPEHPKLKAREQEIALRIDRSISNVENLMQSAEPEARRELEKVHSDLKAVQRKIEQ